MPLGENDRLLTVLTREFGLLRAIAPGSRKHASTLRGRSGLFVINQLLLVPGKSLDKIIQAETQASFPKLSQDLGKLTAAQYLAELCLYQALSEQPQEDLFEALRQRLVCLEQVDSSMAIAILVEGIVQMLHLAGVIPQVEHCSVTRQPIPLEPTDQRWQVGFHPAAGGVVSLAVFDQLCAQERQSSGSPTTQAAAPPSGSAPAPAAAGGDAAPEFPFTARPTLGQNRENERSANLLPQAQVPSQGQSQVSEAAATFAAPPDAARTPASERRVVAAPPPRRYQAHRPVAGTRLTGDEWRLLQQIVALQRATVPSTGLADISPAPAVWLSLERALRYYTQYHFERAIQSAHLIDSCFASLPSTVSPDS